MLFIVVWKIEAIVEYSFAIFLFFRNKTLMDLKCFFKFPSTPPLALHHSLFRTDMQQAASNFFNCQLKAKLIKLGNIGAVETSN